MSAPRVAIVDYGVGNLFSVARACEAAGLATITTSEPDEITRAAAAILPGIGAFGEAMAAIRRLDLVECLRALPERGIPLVGVCLGMQLLMEQSLEFGRHQGLGLIRGTVERLHAGAANKVPHVGWTAIHRPVSGSGSDAWEASLLRDTRDDEPMYFVHSYVVRPRDVSVGLAEATYGGERFWAAVRADSIWGFQFHPERSGPAGLNIYRNLTAMLTKDD